MALLTEAFPPAYVTRHEKAKLRIAATLEGITMSDLIRRAVAAEIKLVEARTGADIDFLAAAIKTTDKDE